MPKQSAEGGCRLFHNQSWQGSTELFGPTEFAVAVGMPAGLLCVGLSASLNIDQ